MQAAADIYARIMFPGAIKGGDPTLSDLQKQMLDATPDCIKVISVDGKLLMMNRAGCRALGVPEDSSFGMPWLPLLPPDVFADGTDALLKAASGKIARFPGKSISPQGTAHWDNLLTPLIDGSGQVLSILCVSRDVTKTVVLERKLTEAVDREKLLAREMNHRIKNLFSVVMGLVSISKREAAASNAPERAIEVFADKLLSVSRAFDAVFVSEQRGGSDVDHIDASAIVSSVLHPYGDRCTIIGSAAFLRRDALTTFALFLHELATNSFKYGALSTKAGNVTVRWTAADNILDLQWIETGGPEIQSPPVRLGFGTEMIDRIVRSGDGTIDRIWRTDGLVVELRFPCLPAREA